MKKLLIILTILPITCFSQITKVDVQIIDITDNINTTKDYATVKIGKQYARQIPIFNQYSNGYHLVENLEDLADTIHITQADYKFDALPMNYHDFTFDDDVVRLKIYAKPFYNFYQNRDFPIALSRKTKNDSVNLKVFCSGYNNPKVRLYIDNEAYNFKPSKSEESFYYQVLSYDKLKNGKFEVQHEKGKENFSFEANQWYQTQYLTPNLTQKPSERELRLIKNYFGYVKKTQTEMRKNRKDFINERDSLVSLIYKLRGQIEPPPPEPMPKEPEIFIIADENTQPKRGIAYFFREMEKKLPESIKYAGNITLELEILKDGHIRYKVLHAMQDANDILFAIKKYLREQTWKPARRMGRVYNQKIILSLNFTPNASAISQTKKFVPEKGMIEINPNKTKTIKLDVGQKAYYQAYVHGSVGFWAKVFSKDSKILEKVDGHFAYHKVQVKGMTGGDNATKTYIFEAKKAGKTKLQIKHTFRGEIRGDFTIKVIVKDAQEDK